MNLHTKNTRGFTLIELLVVIAIIGILASVVLASLNSARDKGADAAVKASINNARAQAELYYDTNGNYTAVCTGTNGLETFRSGAASASGGSAICADGSTSAWAMAGQLKSNTALYYCVDSTGRATTTTGAGITDGSDYTCQ